MTNEQITELISSLFEYFKLKLPTSKLTIEGISKRLSNKDWDLASEAYIEMTMRKGLKASSTNEVMDIFDSFYKSVMPNETPRLLDRSNVDDAYPNGKKHNEWHLFEVSQDPKSYWMLATPKGKAFTIFHDLLHYKLITWDREIYKTQRDLFERKYMNILSRYVVGRTEINYQAALDFVTEHSKNPLREALQLDSEQSKSQFVLDNYQ